MPVENKEEKSVEVLALPEEVDEELLYLYFENKRRSGGGPLQSVEKDGDRALLVFEDAEAATRVLSKGHHVLHNVELSVRRPPSKDRRRLLLRGIKPSTSTEMIELYVENLIGLNLSEYTLYPSKGKDLILIHLSQPFTKDIQNLNVRISRRALDGAKVTLEQIEQTDSIIVENLHPGTASDMLTLYFESSRGGNQKVKDATMLSESTAKVSFVSCESVDLVVNQPHKLDDAELVVKPYFAFFQPAETVSLSNPETGSENMTVRNSMDMSDIPMETSSPSAAGVNSRSRTTSEPLAAAEAAEEVAEEVMEDETEDAAVQILSDHIAITDPGKLDLFQHSCPLQDIKKTHTDFTITVRDDGVHVAGPDAQTLEQIKKTVLDFFTTVVEVQFTLEPEKADLLSRKDVKDRLLQSVNQNGFSSVYTVSDCNVAVTSLSQNFANQACSFLKSQPCQFSIPVDSEYECMLYCREWTEFHQALGFCSVSEKEGSIRVLTLKGMENEKRSAIMDFLTTPIERETVISMVPPMLKYIQVHCHQLLADMTQVSIFPLEAEDNCGLKIHGHPAACQMAEEVLQGVVESLCTRTITVNTPGVSRFLNDEECKSIFKEMETKFQVYITPKQKPWEPLPHQDIFDTAWKMMSYRKFQDDSMQTDGAAGRDPQDDIADVDLYTAEEPTSLSEQMSDAPQPLTTRNATNGLLPLSDQGLGNLEEEAQLSLAIQYSMESSQWTEENDEEQLKKALELSKRMIQDERSSGSAAASPRGNRLRRRSSVSLEDAIKAANTIQIFVVAGYNCDLIRVDIAFGKKVSQRQVEEKLEHRCMKNMSGYHKKCLELIKRKHAVEIQVLGNIITVSGFKDYVTGALCDVKLLLEKIPSWVLERDILRTIQWAQHDPDSSNTTPYSPDATVLFENAWRMKLKDIDILLDDQPHVISFEKMQEHNIASGKNAKISRKLLNLGEVNEDVPEEEYSLLSNMPEATRVNEESDEFQNVVKNFYETIQEYHSKIRIIQVEKLMNRLLYNQYKLKKASVLQRAEYPEIERTLYHGTSETSVKEICIHGFNRSFCGKNATVYGQGVYFAVNSALSVQDQYSPPNSDGHKYIFVSKVLTGDYTKGCHSMKTAPLKETGDIPLRYDSVTDDISKPSMFVIFNDTQAFPEYLITCQRIHR